VLSLCSFPKDKTKSDGHYSSCKECRREFYLQSYKETKHNNYIDNRDEIRCKAKEYYYKTREKQIARVKKYNFEHKEERRTYNREYYREKLSNDIKYKLSRAIRTKIVRTLHKGRKNRQKWEILVGYSVEQLQQHLEEQFKSGMDWSNYGEWHIDHITPISAYDYADYDDVDFKNCWDLDNLQLLWAEENLKKGGVK